MKGLSQILQEKQQAMKFPNNLTVTIVWKDGCKAITLGQHGIYSYFPVDNWRRVTAWHVELSNYWFSFEMPRLASLHILLMISSSLPWLTRFSDVMTFGSIAYPVDEKKKVTLLYIFSKFFSQDSTTGRTGYLEYLTSYFPKSYDTPHHNTLYKVVSPIIAAVIAGLSCL